MSFQTLDALVTRTGTARVDLLPPEIGQARRFRRLQAGLAASMVGVLGLAGGAYALSVGHVSDAQEALDAEQSRTLVLKREQQPYADVPTVLAQIDAAQAMQEAATAYDVAWYGYLDTLATKAPEELTLKSVAFAVTPPTVDATAAEATTTTTTATSGPLAVSGIGTLNVDGTTTSQDTLATWLEALAEIEGITAPTLATSTLDESAGTIAFSVAATVTDDALLAQQ
ncbi:hypothetical protein [Kineococcus glutinatus]|uniref:Tfp pilus assembly protein PilN n=1 Tax=Kineococcus glutinatus TaxID=1070872 RepID=A0ABP9HCH0_9ACTN